MSKKPAGEGHNSDVGGIAGDRLRKLDMSDRQEQEEVLDLYKRALDMY